VSSRLRIAVALALPACLGQIDPGAGTVDDHAAASSLRRPPRAKFEPVADALQVTCGTLDCHGQSGRNLRLFGAHGLRLDAHDTPEGGETAAAEYEASYWALVGLEPEVLSLVTAERGARPERLSFVRKARGHERHKGGTLMAPGDALEACLLSWLAGQVREEPCASIAKTPRPEAPP
jgi:hypothetical protein